jgi:hypothetical protein
MDSSHTTSPALAPPVRGAALEVAVVIPSAGQGAVYAMFEARELAADGLTLAGGLLLERNEVVTLEIRLPDRAVVRARARIAGVGPDSSMRAVFVALDDADRQRLGRVATT